MSEVRQDVEVVKYQKYSFMTIMKILVMCIVISWVMNTFAYITVGLNQVMDGIIMGGNAAVEIYHSCAGN